MTDFDFDKFLTLPRLSALKLSPDGRRLVVSVQRPAPDGKKMRSAIWQLDPDGARPPVRLSRSAPGESVGAFTPDGSLLFSSSRPDPDLSPDDKDDEETTGLWLLPASGGEARLLCAPSGGIEGIRTARSSATIIFAASVFAGAADLGADRARQKARKKSGVEALLFESYPIRHWDHWLGPREIHLFATQLAEDGESITTPVDLTPDAGNALVETTFDVTPDGSTVITEWRDWSDLTNPRERLAAIETRDGSHRFLTELGHQWYGGTACSPDGRFVACVQAEVDEPEAIGDQTLVLVDIETGKVRDLTPELDLWPSSPAWNTDGSAVFFTADQRGHAPLFRVGLADGDVRLVDDECAWTDPQPSPDGKTVYGLSSGYDAPPHPVKVDAGGGSTKRRIPSFKELDELELPGRVERVSTEAGDGQAIESWLVLPKSADADHPAPLIVWVHGGPLGSWNAWHWRWSPHLLAAQGYAILLPDPALSTGYGQAFLQRGWARWGDEPYTDVMAAYDAVLKRADVDAARTGLMGGSFGGYMANWVAGKTSRFRAIVTHASLWELRGFHGTTDSGTWWEREFGDPYADDSVYQAQSPHRLVGNIKTPILVIHGAKDYRVPLSEGLRLWTDLARHGVEAKFLYYPDENHWILKPQNARLWYETVSSFLDRYVRDGEWRRPELV